MYISLSKTFEKITKHQFPEKEEELQQNTAKALLIMMVSGIALSILGLACAPGGISLFLISAPLFYIGYNGQQVLRNIKKANENPAAYKAYWGLGNPDPRKLEPILKENTLFFDWAIEYLARYYIAFKENKT